MNSVDKFPQTCAQLWITAGNRGRRTVPLVSVRPTQCGQTPEVPRRWLSTRCVSTIPIASMSANIVVGPTNAKPFLRSALESATDSAEIVGTWSRELGSGVVDGWNDHTKSTRPPSSLKIGRAHV